jgi:Uncharacterised nucleotidyltransferase
MRNPATTLSPSLLQAVVCEDDAEAFAAWTAWRTTVEIEDLTWPELQMMPLLAAPRLQRWLADDPAAGVLRGIVRRSWLEAQVRMAMVRDATHALAVAGCDPVTVLGPAAQYLRALGSEIVRPVSEIRLLVRRSELAAATGALKAEGWEPRCAPPTGHSLNWSTNISFSRNRVPLYLHWRVLQVPAGEAPACEGEFLLRHDVVEALGSTFRILARDQALIEALSEQPDSADVVPWQMDAALIARAAIDWPELASLAHTYQPQAIARLAELRTLGVSVPALPQPPPPVQPKLAFSGRVNRWTAVRWARRLRAALGGG